MIELFSTNFEDAIRLMSDDTLSKFLDDSERVIFNSRHSASIKNITSLQNKLADLRKVYMIMWGHFRDFMKFKNTILSKELVIKDYRILALGNKDEHAELRMISFILSQCHLLSKRGDLHDTYYMGVSKLCCPNCIFVVKAVNKCVHLHRSNINDSKAEICAVFDSDNADLSRGEIASDCNEEVLIESVAIEAHEMVQLELSNDNNDEGVFSVRDSHDVSQSRWIKPAFLQGKEICSSQHCLVWSTLKYLKDPQNQVVGWSKEEITSINETEASNLIHLERIYHESEPSIKKLRSAAIDNIKKTMYASPSSSDVQVSPPSNFSNKDEREILDDPYQGLFGNE